MATTSALVDQSYFEPSGASTIAGGGAGGAGANLSEVMDALPVRDSVVDDASDPASSSNSSSNKRASAASASTRCGRRTCACVERHPCKLMFAVVFVYLAVALLMIGLGEGAWPIKIASLDNLAKSSNPAYAQHEAMTGWTNALVGNRFETSNQRRRRQLQDGDVHQATVRVIYQLPLLNTGDDDNNNSSATIFDRIAAIKQFEHELLHDDDDNEQPFCVPTSSQSVERLELGQSCSSVAPNRDSPVNYFYPSLVYGGTTWLLDGRGSEGQPRDQSSVLQSWLQDGTSRFFSRGALNGDFSITTASFVFQSTATTGGASALSGYINNQLLGKLQRASRDFRSNFTLSWYGDDLLSTELNNALVHDTILATVSVAVIGVLFFVLMGFDLVLTLVGLLSLGLAFPLSYAFFIVAFGFEDMFALSFLSLYIIFGVGSDACFIILDEMASDTAGEEVVPFAVAWQRSAKATLVTLSTTAVCFLVNASSPINVFREWGIFMGITCLFCWLTVNTVFPLAVLMRRHALTTTTRTKIRSAFHTGLFAVLGKRRKWLLLLVSAVMALVSVGLLFPPGSTDSPFRVGDAKSYSSAFFAPETHNLGRIYALMDEFGWTMQDAAGGGGNGGGGDNNGGGGQVQCPSSAYRVENGKCVLVSVLHTLSVRFVFLYDDSQGPGQCICNLPRAVVLAGVAANTGWPASDVALTEFCQTPATQCGGGGQPSAVIRFTTTDQDKLQALQTQMAQIQPGDSLAGFVVLSTSLATSAPTAQGTSSPTTLSTTTPRPSSIAATRSPSTARPSPTSLPPTTTTTTTPPPDEYEYEYEQPNSEAPTTTTSAPPTAAPTQRAVDATPAPASSAPSRAPSTSGPTQSPTLRQCPPDACSQHGLCELAADAAVPTCTCFLGYAGTNCSEVIEVELNDDSAEKVSIGFGLNMDEPTKLNSAFQLATSPKLQQQLLDICVAFCAANNETHVEGSRCSLAPLSTLASAAAAVNNNNNKFLVDVEALGHRRLIHCAMADFVEYVQVNKGTFPITSPQQFAEWTTRFLQAHGEYVRGVGLIGTRKGAMVFFRNLHQTSISSLQTNAQDANNKYLAWKQLFDPVGGAVSSGLFALSETQAALVDSLWLSLVLSVALTLVGLLLYTRSLSMVVLCLLSMACSMVCLLAVCFVGMGWTLGLVEAVGLMIAVGLMVDYNVHLAYTFSREQDADKALRVISFAIMCACVSSVGTCVVLLFAEMLPFVQFGIIILLSVSLSLAYVFALLTPLLYAVGKTGLRMEKTVRDKLCCKKI